MMNSFFRSVESMVPRRLSITSITLELNAGTEYILEQPFWI